MATLLEKTQQIMKMVEDGQFVEGMEEFYAEDVVNIEGDGTRTEGKATLIANEKAFLEKVTAYHGAKIGAVAEKVPATGTDGPVMASPSSGVVTATSGAVSSAPLTEK